MRLSEAILFGAMLRPQTWQHIFDPNGCATCAIGAALMANGFTRGSELECLTLWPWLESRMNCPSCNEDNTIFFIICYHLGFHRCNDWTSSQWTRERIADWVATIEPQPTVETHQESLEQVAHE